MQRVRVLRHRIEAKTSQQHKELDLVSYRNIGNCNGVTDFRYGQPNQISVIQAPIAELKWWAEPD